MDSTLLEFMYQYEVRFDKTVEERKNLYDERDGKIQQCLTRWAENVPESMKTTYKHRIERVIEYILYHRFIYSHYNARTQEVFLYYGDKAHPDMCICLARAHLLSKDESYDYKEIIFPGHWPSQTPEQTPKPAPLAIEEVSQMSAVEW